MFKGFSPEEIIAHHTAVSVSKNNKQYEAVKNYHIGKGWGDIGYHFFIEYDGDIISGRSENTQGAHTLGMNEKAFGICLAGDFDNEYPTSEQLKSLRIIIKHLRNKYNIPRNKVRLHRDYATKSCPGVNFTRNILKACMKMKELKRDRKGGFWFVKEGDNGKQKINTSDKGVAALLTVISRELGVETVSSKTLDLLEDKKYF